MIQLFFPHYPVTNLIDSRIITFSDNRIDGENIFPFFFGLLYHPGNHGIRHFSDIQCIGQGNGRFKSSELLYLHKTARFSETIMHVGRRQVLFQKRIAFSRHNHRHSGMLISVFHRRMAYPHPRYIRNFVSRPTFMVSDPISVITDSFLFHPVSSLSFMYSRTFSFLITTGTKKTPKMHFSLTLRFLLSSVHTSSHNFSSFLYIFSISFRIWTHFAHIFLL